MRMWKAIRRRVLREGVGESTILRETGMHWRTLEKILAHSEPPGHRRAKLPPKPKIGPFLGRIEEIIKTDQGMPKKQRHTAKRIFERLQEKVAAVILPRQNHAPRMHRLAAGAKMQVGTHCGAAGSDSEDVVEIGGLEPPDLPSQRPMPQGFAEALSRRWVPVGLGSGLRSVPSGSGLRRSGGLKRRFVRSLPGVSRAA